MVQVPLGLLLRKQKIQAKEAYYHSNPVSRIIKITHAHNLHVKMLDFVPFTIRT